MNHRPHGKRAEPEWAEGYRKAFSAMHAIHSAALAGEERAIRAYILRLNLFNKLAEQHRQAHPGKVDAVCATLTEYPTVYSRDYAENTRRLEMLRALPLGDALPFKKNRQPDELHDLLTSSILPIVEFERAAKKPDDEIGKRMCSLPDPWRRNAKQYAEVIADSWPADLAMWKGKINLERGKQRKVKLKQDRLRRKFPRPLDPSADWLEKTKMDARRGKIAATVATAADRRNDLVETVTARLKTIFRK